MHPVEVCGGGGGLDGLRPDVTGGRNSTICGAGGVDQISDDGDGCGLADPLDQLGDGLCGASAAGGVVDGGEGVEVVADGATGGDHFGAAHVLKV